MALFTEGQVRAAARSRVQQSARGATVTAMLLEQTKASAAQTDFDIFLSHSIKDAELVLGIVHLLETFHHYSVYVDWINDAQLDRSKVTPRTARKLRRRMSECKSLFYLTTTNASNSKWMPWECGYFDGLKEKVAILPIVKEAAGDEFYGQEYLGLYPYCVQEMATDGTNELWIHASPRHYLWYPVWVVTPNAEIVWKVAQ